MKLLVKTLKGEKFNVECEPTQTVLEVKGIIVSLKVMDCILFFFCGGESWLWCSLRVEPQRTIADGMLSTGTASPICGTAFYLCQAGSALNARCLLFVVVVFSCSPHPNNHYLQKSP